MRYHHMSSMNNSVNESTVSAVVTNIRNTKPNLEDKLIKAYSKVSGIDLSFVDLRTAVRGFMMSGQI